MFGASRAQFAGRREAAPMPGFNSGHRQYQPPPPASYRTQQPSYDDDDDDEEWDDDSEDDVYENESQMPNPALPGRRDRQPPPAPGRPAHNPPNDHRPMRPPSNYPQHRPFNDAPPPLQPRDNPQDDADDDDFYMPIDASQDPGRALPVPSSFPRHNAAFSPAHGPGPVAPSRPSFPPPSSSGGRPPMPTPQSNQMHDMGAGSDRPPRIDRNPPPARSSRNNRSSPRSSPGPPSRDNSGRSSGGRQPHRGGSGGSRSSQDSNSSGDHRTGGQPYRPPVPSELPSRSGGFELFKNSKPPGFDSTLNPPNIASKPKVAALPQFSRPKPDKPAKPIPSGFSSFDRKPIPSPKVLGKAPPRKEKPKLEVSSELEERFSKALPRPSEVPPNCTPNSYNPAARLPPTTFPKRAMTVEQQPWFKDVARGEAQSMIERSRPQDGCFIVRPGRHPNPYSLTVFSGGLCNLVIRRRSDNNFALGNQKINEKAFPSVVELIQYHMENSLVLAEGKGEVKLLGPP